MNRTKRIKAGMLQGILIITTQAVLAVPTVDMTATPLGGGIHQYDFSISNSGPEDIAIVSIIDAPVNDPLIPLTLVAPTGFIASYDPGLGLTFGFVDFLGDTDLFAAGATIGGFGFQSASSPAAHFRSFEALSIQGNFFSGAVNVKLISAPVPDTSGTLVMGSLGLLALALVRHRFQGRQF